MTSKFQVTLPKVLAERYAIRPGDEIAWEAAGDVIRVVPSGRVPAPDISGRLRLFDKASQRQRRRNRAFQAERAPAGRGWTREQLYDRGRAR